MSDKIYSFQGAITATSIALAMPPGKFFVTEPIVLVTVKGTTTNVDWTLSYETVDGAEVFTGITLTFQAGAVGKRFSLLMVDQYAAAW